MNARQVAARSDLTSSRGVFGAVSDEANRRFVVGVMRRLTRDPMWTDHIIDRVETGHLETRCFVAWAAQLLAPRAYLEVGVRRGFSMAMVAARSPAAEIYGFDAWVDRYGGVENPGPRFVQQELGRLGYRKKAHFITGDSHKTLPAFFLDARAPLPARIVSRLRFPRRPQAFELITIDGDHSLLGAYRDLLDTMPRCAVGGIVLFDDIAPDLSSVDTTALEGERGPDPHGWKDLLGVWRAVRQQFPNFRYFEYTSNPPGVGVGIRLA